MIVTRILSGNGALMKKLIKSSRHILVKRHKQVSENTYEITFDSPDDMDVSGKRSIKGFILVDEEYDKGLKC